MLRLAPEHPVAWNGVGLVLAHLRKFEDARNAFARAIEARADYAEAHYNLSFALSNLGDFAGSLRETKRALELDPYYTPQKFELAVDLEFEDPLLEIAPDVSGEQRDGDVSDFAFETRALDQLFDELAPRPSLGWRRAAPSRLPPGWRWPPTAISSAPAPRCGGRSPRGRRGTSASSR